MGYEQGYNEGMEEGYLEGIRAGIQEGHRQADNEMRKELAVLKKKIGEQILLNENAQRERAVALHQSFAPPLHPPIFSQTDLHNLEAIDHENRNFGPAHLDGIRDHNMQDLRPMPPIDDFNHPHSSTFESIFLSKQKFRIVEGLRR